MEKIEKTALTEIGDLILEGIRQLFPARETSSAGDDQDPGIEMTLNSTPVQQAVAVHFPTEVTLMFKIYPHRNTERETVTRLEVFQSKFGEFRGNRISRLELPKSSDLKADVMTFMKDVLQKAQIKLPGSSN